MLNRARSRQYNLDRWSIAIVSAIALIAFGMRLINLGHSDLTFDESASFLIARMKLSEMIPYLLQAIHEHPPGYYVLLSGWMQLAGSSESMLRFLSVVFGTLSIPVMYQWVRQAINRRAGIIAALILSVTPVHIFYSQDARMYTLVGLLALTTWWLALKLQKRDRNLYWIAYAACALFGLITHYYMALVLGSQFVYWLLTWQHSRRLIVKGSLMLGVPIVLAGLYMVNSPGIMSTLRQMFSDGLGTQATPGALRSLAADLIFGVHGNLGISAWSIVLIIMVLGIVAALSGRAGVKRSTGIMMACALLIPLISVILFPETISVRYVLFLIFPVVLALTTVIMTPLALESHSIQKIKWLPTSIALAALIGLNLSRLPDSYAALESNYGRLMKFIRTNYQAGDGVIFNGPWQSVMQSYYPIGNIPTVYLPPRTPPALDPIATQPQLEELLKQSSRLWVIPIAVEAADPNRFVAAWMNQYAYRALATPDFQLYYAPPLSLTAILPTPLRFGSVIELSSARIATTTVEANGAVFVELNWRALKTINGDVQVTLDMIDQNGEVWGERIYQPGERFATADQWNSGLTITDRQAVMIDPGTPPGEYRLRATVQRASTGETLPSINQRDPTYVFLADLHVSASTQNVPDDRLPGTQLNVRFQDSLSLISYRLPSTQFVQGGVMPITLYWRALNGNRSVNVDVNLVDQNGKVIDTSTGPLGPAWYRAPDWQLNEIVATSAALHIPAHLDAGTYRLQVIVRGASNRSLIASGPIERAGFLGLWTEHVTTESDSWILGDVSIAARNRNYNVPAIQHPLPVRFGDQIQLLGYDLNLSGLRLGQPVLITFYWQALKAIDQNYVVFTHLLDSTGVQRGQHDSMPNGGLNPTPFWAAGEVIADSYSIPLEADAPAGPYTLDFGWYQSNDGTRLAAIAADGSRYRDDIVSIPGLAINQ